MNDSGGIYAIQMAKAMGCKVIATASRRNEEFLRGLGVGKVGTVPP